MKQPFQPNDMAVIWYIRDYCDGWPYQLKLCYIMLYARMNADRWAWPSKATLAADMSMSKAAAIRALNELEALGLFEAKEYRVREEDGGQDSTWIRLKAPWEADYRKRPEYFKPPRDGEGGVSHRDRGVSLTETGGSVSQTQGLSPTDTGPCLSQRHKAKQEKLTNEGEEEEVAAASKAETWYEFYERKFARTISPVDYQKVAELQARGVTDELIIHVLEEAIRQKKRNKLGWVISVIADKIPEGIRTLDDWLRREREVAAAAQTKGADKPDRRRPLRDPIATADTPRSKWEVQMLPEDLGEPTEQRPPGSDSRAAVG